MNSDFLKPKAKKENQTDTTNNEDKLLDQVSTEEPGPAILLDQEGEALVKESKPRPSGDGSSKNPFKKFGNWFSGLDKKQKAIFVIVAIIVLGGGGFSLSKALSKPGSVAEKKSEAKKEEPPKPTTEPSKLTGVTVPIDMNKRPVTGIMIENSPDARPQSGLNAAGVVFEAIAEGGITRFLTLFQEAQPDYIGPVRSARPYYIDWLQGFDASYAHAGGSGDAKAKIASDKIKDLDQFFNANAYMRVNNRVAPHNLYTTMAKMDELNRAKGYNSSTFESFPRKEESKAATQTAKTIDLSISGPLYNVHYDYDATKNSYLRSEGGQPHKDLRSGEQLQPKVVIANVMSYVNACNGVNSCYGTIGSGKAFIFQDGTVTEGTWSKSSSKGQITWKDSNGAAIKLNPGQTWITAVNNNPAVSYKP